MGNILRNQQYCIATIVATLLATQLAGCGGGASNVQAPLSCTLGASTNCGGSVQPAPTRPLPGPTPAPTPDPVAKVATVSLVFSSNELASAGASGSEVTVTALVKTAENTAVAGARVEFSADSGLLAAAAVLTDQSGKASATLGIGGSKLNRPIQVSAKVGSQGTSGMVSVTGTRLMLSGPAFLSLGTTADLVATLVDSADRPIAGAFVLASTAIGNSVQVAAKASDSRGQVALKLSASKRGAEQLTLSALGAITTRTILIGGSDVTLTPSVAVDTGGVETVSQVAVGACAPVGGSYMIGGTAQSGNVTLRASRGLLYQEATCNVSLTGAMALAAGKFPGIWIRSDNAGVSTIDASIAGGPSGTTRIEFTAAVGAMTRIDLQPDSAVLGSGERSTLIAVVRDGTAANNLVRGATVQFSILADPSGGNLLSPASSVTGSDGIARAVFVAGPFDAGKNGVSIQAQIAELPSAISAATLTVNKKSFSIQFGTGNSLVEYSSAVLQKEFVIFVSDSAGNPVRDVTVAAAAWPTAYKKGYYEYYIDKELPGDLGTWRIAANRYLCPNEDAQRKGMYDKSSDSNNNGVLDPGIPLSVSAGGKTDAVGMTSVFLRYPRDRGNWVQIELSVTGIVSGTEYLSRNTFWLPALASDLYDKRGIAPPGAVSPYGMGMCEVAN